MNDEEPPSPGDIRFADSGEIEVFDGKTWSPIRRLPEEGPAVFRDGAGNGRQQPETR